MEISCMMNTKANRAESRLGYWAEKMKERAASGETVNRYCETRGIHANTYYYWRRKLREADQSAIVPRCEKPAPRGWSAVSVSEGARGNGLTVEIGKSRIHVGKDTDEELLVKVCRTLAGLC
jgi:transposase-like protein